MGISLLMFTQYWGGVKFRSSSVYCSKGGNIKVASILALTKCFKHTDNNMYFMTHTKKDWISSNILWCSLQQRFMQNKILNRKTKQILSLVYYLLSGKHPINRYNDDFNLVHKKKSKTVNLDWKLLNCQIKKRGIRNVIIKSQFLL